MTPNRSHNYTTSLSATSYPRLFCQDSTLKPLSQKKRNTAFVFSAVYNSCTGQNSLQQSWEFNSSSSHKQSWKRDTWVDTLIYYLSSQYQQYLSWSQWQFAASVISLSAINFFLLRWSSTQTKQKLCLWPPCYFLTNPVVWFVGDIELDTRKGKKQNKSCPKAVGEE